MATRSRCNMATRNPSSVQPRVISENRTSKTLESGFPSSSCSALFNTAPVERFRPRYPRFSAIPHSHPSSSIHRRFEGNQARILRLFKEKFAVVQNKLDVLNTREDWPSLVLSVEMPIPIVRIRKQSRHAKAPSKDMVRFGYSSLPG